MWYFSASCPRKNIVNVCITNYCKCVCNIPEWTEEELLFCVVLRFKYVFELGFKLWTQTNDNLVDNFIVGWILVMSKEKGIYQVEELKSVKILWPWIIGD